MDITDEIREDDGVAVAALLSLYHNQTSDEQVGHHTAYKNEIGFNAYDAPILTSIAEQYLKTEALSSGQINALKKLLPKYKRQLPIYLPRKPVHVVQAYTRKLMAATVRDGKLEVRFEFPRTPEGKNQFMATLAKVRELEGNKHFYGQDGTWRCQLTPGNVKALKSLGFSIGERLAEWYKATTKVAYVRRAFNFSDLKRQPYPFQAEGVGFIISRGGRALVADDMGLGKTIQALAWLHHVKAYPALIVVPASVKLNWQKEIEMTLPDDITVNTLYGRSGNGFLGVQSDITIINYDILDAWKDKLPEYDTLVGDEIHNIKNKSTLRSKAFRVIAKRCKHLVFLSGTPITNRPVEFFNALSLLDPETFGDFWRYAKKYCNPRMGFRGGWDFTGSSNAEELHAMLTKTIMIRRKKSDVLKDLPPKVRSVVPIEIDNMDEYRYAETNFFEWVRRTYGDKKASSAAAAEALARIEYLKQLTIKGKMAGIVPWVEDFISTGEKLVLFATHHSTIDGLKTKFGGKAVKIDGRDNLQVRQNAITSFQGSDETRLLIGNIKAAGQGINLTAASNTCFLELGWTPGEHDQAEDRVHRIGQEADSVTAYFLMAQGTIEEDIAALIDGKRQVISQVLDGKGVGDESVLSALLNKILGRD